MPGSSADRAAADPGETADLVLARVTAALVRAGVATPGADARALIAHARAAGGARETGSSDSALDQAVARRAAREPLEYILGTARFRSLRLAVGPGVFVPRPESEVAAGWAAWELRRSVAAQPVAVDLGAGSGAIALALAAEVPAALVYAVEVSPDAFRWLVRNCRALAPGNARPVLADLQVALPELDSLVDVVVANPPYIPAGAIPKDTEVRLHSPGVALFGGADGLDVVRGVARAARRLLVAGGLLVIEHGELQARAVAEVLAAGGFSDIELRRDHHGRDRATAARLRHDGS